MRLGRKLGQGGEGAIYELVDQPGLVAKIFHVPLTPLRAEKIRAMVACAARRSTALTAWPIELLSLPTGEPIGLTMPKVDRSPRHPSALQPEEPARGVSGADWRFLVRVAANVARAFATVHAAGRRDRRRQPWRHPGRAGRAGAADRLRQLPDPRSGERCSCDVGVPTFTPPELQDQALTGVVRSESHDNFGLAVMIFLVLFMGRHPFAGRYLGEGDMPIEQAIRGLASPTAGTPSDGPAAGHAAARHRVGAGGGAVRARLRRHSGYLGRPSAVEWMEALERCWRRQLVECPLGIAHWHSSELVGLPVVPHRGGDRRAAVLDRGLRGAAALFDLGLLAPSRSNIPHPGRRPTAADRQASSGRRSTRCCSERRALHGLYAFLLRRRPSRSPSS